MGIQLPIRQVPIYRRTIFVCHQDAFVYRYIGALKYLEYTGYQSFSAERFTIRIILHVNNLTPQPRFLFEDLGSH